MIDTLLHNMENLSKSLQESKLNVLIVELRKLFMNFSKSSSYSLINKRCESLNSDLEILEEKILIEIKKTSSSIWKTNANVEENILFYFFFF